MKKYIYALAALVAMTATSCSDDDYNVGPQSEGAYFSNETAQVHYFGMDGESFEVTISRTNSEAAQTIDLIVDDESGLFNVPNTVTFAAGANSANITITFDATKLDFVDYPIVITIPEDEAYQYGATSFEFIAGFEEDLRWEDAGIATYRDDLITTFWGVDSFDYEVPIQKHMTKAGRYRLVNPYGEYYPYNEEGDYAEGDHYLVIHAENPNAVYCETSYTGCDWGYGEIVVTTYAWAYMNQGYTLEDVYKAGFCGKLVKGVITFPASTWLIGMSDYNNGKLYDSNLNGLWRVVLPGFEVPEDEE